MLKTSTLISPKAEYVGWKQKLILIVSGCFGNSEIEEKFYPQICKILRHPTCTGMIGGVKNEAYYIVGAYGGEFLILDPHYVNVKQFLNFRNIHRV